MPNVQIIVWHASEVNLSVRAHPTVQWVEIDLPPRIGSILIMITLDKYYIIQMDVAYSELEKRDATALIFSLY